MYHKKVRLLKSVFISIFIMALLAVIAFPFSASADGEPYVVTRNASSVSQNRATLNGSVDGNGRSTRAWFEYGTNTNLDATTSKELINNGYEEYSDTIINLRANTIYYFRVAALNAKGTVYGNTF